jgi:hypothetical protein
LSEPEPLLLTHSHVSLPNSEALYRIVFVTLGALTAPHLVVTAIWERGSRTNGRLVSRGVQ